MFTLGKKVGFAALLALSATSANALVLDSFNYDVDLIADGAGTVDTATFTSVTDTTPAGDVTYTLTNAADANSFGGITTNASFSGGQLVYAEKPAVDGSLLLEYFDADATSPIDLTDAGVSTNFYFDVDFADVGFTLDITVTDAFSNTSTAQYILDHTVTSSERVFLSFADFTGTANFALVTNIDGLVNSNPGSDLILSEVGTIPEPATLAVFGLGLIGFAASRRKKS